MKFIKRSWSTVDAYLANVMELPQVSNSDQQAAACMRARVKESNYIKADALLQASGTDLDFIQTVRTLISRGSLGAAEDLLNEAITSAEGPSDLLQDLHLELCRVHYQCGRWNDSILSANTYLAFPQNSAISRLSAIQVRALCWFELGDWVHCLSDLETTRPLMMLYSQSQCRLYAEVLRVKTLARMYGLSSVRAPIDDLWQKAKSGDFPKNADTLLTLIRLDSDLKRLNGESFAPSANACLQLARAMGDEQYAALSTLDLAFSPGPLRLDAQRLLPELRKKFKKVDMILSELQSGKLESQTTRDLAAYRSYSSSDANSEGLCFESNYSFIILPQAQILVDLKTLSVRPMELQDKATLILRKFSGRRVSKSVFFSEIWGLRYKPELHDNVIRTSLSRVRKQTGIKILCRKLEITFPEGLVVDLGTRIDSQESDVSSRPAS